MEKEYDTYAYFRVSNFDCDPQNISELLGLIPNRSFKKGDLITEKSDRRWKHSSWEYYSSLPRSEPCQDAHIQNLVDVMLQKKEIIKKLNEKYEVCINCVGYYNGTNPGFHMSSKLINACAILGLCIDFDLYTVDIVEIEEVDSNELIH